MKYLIFHLRKVKAFSPLSLLSAFNCFIFAATNSFQEDEFLCRWKKNLLIRWWKQKVLLFFWGKNGKSFKAYIKKCLVMWAGRFFFKDKKPAYWKKFFFNSIVQSSEKSSFLSFYSKIVILCKQLSVNNKKWHYTFYIKN